MTQGVICYALCLWRRYEGGTDIMLVSTKGRYALRVMIDLAEHRQDGRTPLKKIAARQGISEKYLENILSALVRHGMLSGLRGKGEATASRASPRSSASGRSCA